MQLYEWLSRVSTDRGSGKALVYRDTYLSWRGLLHRVDRRAQELHAMGIASGSWVGLMLGNVPDFVILALALSKIDAVVVPLDPTLGNRELEMMLEAAPLRALITRPRGGEAGQLPVGPPFYANPVVTRPAVVSRPNPPSKFVPENRRRLQGTLLTCSLYRRAPLANLIDSDASIVQFTASVGGDPKGVVRTTTNLGAAAEAIGETLDIKDSDRLLCTVPLHHSYGFDFGLVTTLAHGATLFLEDEISPKRITKLLREQSVDIFPGNPGLFGSLVRVPTVKPLKISGARYLSSGSRMPGLIAENFYQRFGIRLLSCYHSTQGGPLAIDRGGKDPETVGKAFAGIELRVAAPNGDKVAAAETGPVWVRSKALSMLSVPKMHLPKRDHGVPIGEVDRDKWFRTGDIGQIDRNGKLTITGREDDLVKVDGKRLALGEVEGCLEAFPKVKAAQARVITDDLGGPMVVAKVVRAGLCKAEDIIDHCARNLAPYKVPRQIEFCETI
ncbi:MAG TPA: class I adenylate-forming enzyme family protein [Polyangia bacterium]|jgi:long-chain acyl-CoA synthetase|nr:class I adenylate-forming enzyme family protein [Polyangia bacterium]